MTRHQEDHKKEYGGINTLSSKERVQFMVAFVAVILALFAFFIKIYFL